MLLSLFRFARKIVLLFAVLFAKATKNAPSTLLSAFFVDVSLPQTRTIAKTCASNSNSSSERKIHSSFGGLFWLLLKTSNLLSFGAPFIGARLKPTVECASIRLTFDARPADLRCRQSACVALEGRRLADFDARLRWRLLRPSELDFWRRLSRSDH